MTEESPHRNKPSVFGKKLRESLAVGGGVNDDNLLSKLDADLRICFSIELNESDVTVARQRIADKLNPLIDSLTKGVKECSSQTYRDIVRVSFNLYDELDFGNRTLLQRWELFAEHSGGYPSRSSGQRILNSALNQIEQRLCSAALQPKQRPKLFYKIYKGRQRGKL